MVDFPLLVETCVFIALCAQTVNETIYLGFHYRSLSTSGHGPLCHL